MHAELIRVTGSAIDIKVRTDADMHVLQWRRNLFWDEVLLDGKRQAASRGLWGRETIYGLVFGRDENGEGGKRVIFTIDPRTNWNKVDDAWDSPIMGARLETADGVILALGSLDPREQEPPETFEQAIRKFMGMKWRDKDMR